MRSPEVGASTAQLTFEAARPRFLACLEAAHARIPLAEEGAIVFIRRQTGSTIQAAAVLEPARGDLAACLRETLRGLHFAPTTRVRVLTRWTAPPPKTPKRYFYPQR